MPVIRRVLIVPLAAAVVAALLAFTAPAAHAVGAAIRITEFAYGGKASGAGGGDGEYTEITNTGDAAQNLTGWKFDNSAATFATALPIDGLGTLQPGESAIITDLSAAEFRAEWGLYETVKVLSNGKTHTLNSGPNSIHIYNDSGTEVDSLSYLNGFESAKGLSAWVDAAHLGAKADTTGWTISTLADGEGSWASATGSVGSPGASTRGTTTAASIHGTPGGIGSEAPCQTENAGSAPGTLPGDNVTWPGGSTPATVDAQCAWVTPLSGQDLSGLAFDPTNPNVLYAVKNKSHVFKLVKSGGVWVNDTANDWSAGKDLRFPGNTGLPDSEGLTVGPDGMLYITTERDNAASGVPLDSFLKFDPAAAGTTLVASDQWVVTSDLGLNPATDANLGFEGVALVPDSFLTATGFKTDTGALYTPAAYPGKALAGLFFGAVEKTGHLIAYALKTDHTFTRVADIDTGMVGVMDAQFDADLGRIWAHCDNTCGNSTALLKVGADGHFAVDKHFATPASLPNYNLEGLVVAPVSTATGGTRQVLWTDDGNRFGHSLWAGTVNVDLGLTQTLTPTPLINGTPAFGGQVTAGIGSWDPGVTTHYVWKDGSTVLATDAPLSLANLALIGKTVTLEVTGTKTGFADAKRTATTTITTAALTTNKPVISGTVKVGELLTATVTPWGPSPVALGYQWLADGAPIAGATGSTLRLGGALAGKTISVRVTGTKTGYTTATATSDPTAGVALGTIVAPRPVIKGKPVAGKRLTAVRGTWAADGEPITISYRWFVNGQPIKGATSSTLVTKRAWLGKRISVKVTGKALGHVTVTKASVATAQLRRK